MTSSSRMGSSMIAQFSWIESTNETASVLVDMVRSQNESNRLRSHKQGAVRMRELVSHGPKAVETAWHLRIRSDETGSVLVCRERSKDETSSVLTDGEHGREH